VITDTQDTKKKLTKAAARSKREQQLGTQMNNTGTGKKQGTTASIPQQKDAFASLYD
jgi:hypothetical protein